MSNPLALLRHWSPALVILGIALFYSHGLSLIDRHVPGVETVPAGETIDLGHGVSLRTIEGWALDRAKTRPHETAAFVRDGSSIALTTLDWQETEADLLARGHRLFDALSGLHVRGADTPFRTAAGLEGKSFAIHGPHLEGRVWVIFLPQKKCAFAARVRSPAGQGAAAQRDALALLATLQIQ